MSGESDLARLYASEVEHLREFERLKKENARLVDEIERLRKVVVAARNVEGKYRTKLQNAMLRIGSGGDDAKTLHAAMVALDEVVKEYEAAQ